MDRLQEQMICSRAVNDGYIETIRGLKNQLTEEKSRVLVLSSLCGHVRTLSNALSSYVQVRHCYDYNSKINLSIVYDQLLSFCFYYVPTAQLKCPATNTYLRLSDSSQEECNRNSRAQTEFGSTVPSYHYGNLYPTSSRDAIQNFTNLRIERRMGSVTKTRFLHKLETDASNQMLLQWVNYVSLEGVSTLPRLLPDTAGDDGSIDFSLPMHEEVYEVVELRNGKTLSRVVFFLIYSTSPFSSRSETFSTFGGEDEFKIDFSSEVKKEKDPTFNSDHLKALKEAENNPEILLKLTVKYASDFLHLPLYNFQDILDGTKKETFTFLGNLFLSSPPTRIGIQEENPQILLTENNDVKTVLQKSLLKAEQGRKSLIEVEEALKEYYSPPKKISPGVNSNLNRIAHAQGMMIPNKN